MTWLRTFQYIFGDATSLSQISCASFFIVSYMNTPSFLLIYIPIHIMHTVAIQCLSIRLNTLWIDFYTARDAISKWCFINITREEGGFLFSKSSSTQSLSHETTWLFIIPGQGTWWQDQSALSSRLHKLDARVCTFSQKHSINLPEPDNTLLTTFNCGSILTSRIL